LARAASVERVWVSPGNGGTTAWNVAPPLSSSEDPAQVVEFCRDHGIDLVVIGPEAPLAAGLSDRLREAGLACFGPSQAAARLETSKSFAKEFMVRWGIPTAGHESHRDLGAADEACARLWPVVIKASGLAAGKGVWLPDSRDEAREVLRALLVERTLGEAGAQVVIEERLCGPEVSVLAFCDGRRALPMLPARDHKRAWDGDRGPNTGGMGAFAPVEDVTQEELGFIADHILQRAVEGMAAEGAPYVGVLYAGVMLTPSGPKALEFNARFGDPEAQTLLPLLESDLAELLRACVEGRLTPELLRWKPQAAATVVVASPNYPDDGPRGLAIQGAAEAERAEEAWVFHAGTRATGEGLVTSGGRVFAVTGVGVDRAQALARAYGTAQGIAFDGAWCRSDIGRPLARLVVLASGNGSNLQAILDACASGRLRAQVVAVVSNKPSAYALRRGAEAGARAEVVAWGERKAQGWSRARYDEELARVVASHRPDWVVLAGWMLVLGEGFLGRFGPGRVINLHPALPGQLPGTDAIRRAWEAGRVGAMTHTGVMVHEVVAEVDAGPVLAQETITLDPSETLEALEARVHAVEHRLLVEVLAARCGGPRPAAARG
jgi:formyltetrahydrofolate-dependent phosphoribosylglycinamide formyltransferase